MYSTGGWGVWGRAAAPNEPRVPERSEGGRQKARSADCLTAGKLAAGVATSAALAAARGIGWPL